MYHTCLRATKVRSGDIHNPRLGPNCSRECVLFCWASESSAEVHRFQKADSCWASFHVRPHQPRNLGFDLRRTIAHLPSRGKRQCAPTNYKNRRFLLEFIYGRITHSFSASTCGKDWDKLVRFITPLIENSSVRQCGARV